MQLSDRAINVLQERYFLKDKDNKTLEDWEGLCNRVATFVAKAEAQSDRKKYKKIFYNMMKDMIFLPNTPTLMNAGTKHPMLNACFVLGIDDSIDGIFETLKLTAKIHQWGGGTGFNFSNLRAAGSRVRSTNGVASGPISFMKVFNEATETIKQGGKRRGANMGLLSIDHDDAEAFINAKQTDEDLKNFNLSLAMTDKFMKSLDTDRNKKLFDLLVHRSWFNGDPGLIFIDTINKYNPTPWLGKIDAVNPCSEAMLLAKESCNLGSICLTSFLIKKDNTIKFDWEQFKTTIHNSIRFLDNVIDVQIYPLPEIEQTVKLNRKVGLGLMGFADLLIMMSIKYDSDEAFKFTNELAKFFQTETQNASEVLAAERGGYPSQYINGNGIRKGIKRVYRNATRTALAPTGTISIIADCSSGIEPNFMWEGVTNRMDKQQKFYHPLAGKLLEKKIALPDYFITADAISPLNHVKMQATWQKYIDMGISKTINFSNNATEKDIAEAFIEAWKSGCKGITCYRDGSKTGQVLQKLKKDKEDGTLKEFVYSEVSAPKLPAVLDGRRHKIKISAPIEGKEEFIKCYIAVQFWPNTKIPCEVLFNTKSKNMEKLLKENPIVSQLLELIMTGISKMLAHRVPLKYVIKWLEDLPNQWMFSIPAQMGKVLKEYIPEVEAVVESDKTVERDYPKCPKEGCYGKIIYEQGCWHCNICGYSEKCT